jgi:hypothetical protein
MPSNCLDGLVYSRSEPLNIWKKNTYIYIKEEAPWCLWGWRSIDCHVKWQLCSYGNGAKGGAYPQNFNHPFDRCYKNFRIFRGFFCAYAKTYLVNIHVIYFVNIHVIYFVNIYWDI